jgi:hypothetical protein
MPSVRPGWRRASRIAVSSSGTIGRPAQLLALALGPRKSSADAFLNDRTLELGKHAHHLKHCLARHEALLMQE